MISDSTNASGHKGSACNPVGHYRAGWPNANDARPFTYRRILLFRNTCKTLAPSRGFVAGRPLTTRCCLLIRLCGSGALPPPSAPLVNTISFATSLPIMTRANLPLFQEGGVRIVPVPRGSQGVSEQASKAHD